MAYRRTFKASALEHIPEWVQEGQDKGQGVPLEPAPDKSCLLPLPPPLPTQELPAFLRVLLLLHPWLARNINLSR